MVHFSQFKVTVIAMVNIDEAKRHLSKLVDAAMNGQETIIVKSGKPAAKLVPITAVKTQRRFGVLKDKIRIAEDFDAPLRV